MLGKKAQELQILVGDLCRGALAQAGSQQSAAPQVSDSTRKLAPAL
jgi:hypothetical protein